MAGADRVEGCIFGNGERTGNVDIVTLALNLYVQGISPNLDFSDIQNVIDVVTACNDLPVHPRHPYAGELVFTAFSGSHQDAIKKGFETQARRHKEAEKTGEDPYWEIPYLPIDPQDIGCSYEAVIRVNSQSGKGGIAFIVKQALGLDMPRKLQISFYQVVQDIADREAREMTIEDITNAFKETYKYGGAKYAGRITLCRFQVSSAPEKKPNGKTDGASDTEGEPEKRFDGTVIVDGVPRVIRGNGNGPVSALLDALRTHLDLDFVVREYNEHSIGEGTNVRAASYIELVEPVNKTKTDIAARGWWGVGVESDITGSGLRAILSAVSRAIGDRPLPELKLNLGFGTKSRETDIADAVLHTLKLELPRKLLSSFYEVVQRAALDAKAPITLEELAELFKQTYRFDLPNEKLALQSFSLTPHGEQHKSVVAQITVNGKPCSIRGRGNGPISAFVHALEFDGRLTLNVREFAEHAIGGGSRTVAASYIELLKISGGESVAAWGVGSDADTTRAGYKAVVSAANGLDLDA